MIFCVEDDAAIRDIELYALNSTGFEAKGFETGLACWEALAGERPQLILLDVMLPEMDGVTLLKKIKADAALQEIPVIMATAKGAEYDKILGLDLGADDYLVKPFGMMEMVARVRAVLRRAAPPAPRKTLQCGGLVMDLNAHTVTTDGTAMALTHKEYDLLRLLLENPATVFTRDRLFSTVWGMDYYGETRTVDMHVRTLRQKLGAYGAKITTVRGVGYRLEADK